MVVVPQSPELLSAEQLRRQERRRVSLGATIAALRKKRGLTQAQLAEAVRVNKRGIIRVEQGSTSLTVDVLMRMADALGVRASELFRLVELEEQQRTTDSGDAQKRL